MKEDARVSMTYQRRRNRETQQVRGRDGDVTHGEEEKKKKREEEEKISTGNGSSFESNRVVTFTCFSRKKK